MTLNVRMEITVEGEPDLERFAGALARLMGGYAGNGHAGNGHAPPDWEIEAGAAARLGLEMPAAAIEETAAPVEELEGFFSRIGVEAKPVVHVRPYAVYISNGGAYGEILDIEDGDDLDGGVLDAIREGNNGQTGSHR